MTHRQIENKIEKLEESQNTDNGVTVVPVDESGQPREIDSIENAESANLIVTIAVSDKTYSTWTDN